MAGSDCPEAVQAQTIRVPSVEGTQSCVVEVHSGAIAT